MQLPCLVSLLAIEMHCADSGLLKTQRQVWIQVVSFKIERFSCGQRINKQINQHSSKNLSLLRSISLNNVGLE